MKIDEFLKILNEAKSIVIKPESPLYRRDTEPLFSTPSGKKAHDELLLYNNQKVRPFGNGSFESHKNYILTAIEKINDFIKNYQGSKEDLEIENGKIYNVKLKTAQEEAEKAIREINADISKTTDPIKLDQLTKRYESLQDAKRQLTSLNDKFSADPSSVSLAEIQRLYTRIPEFAKNSNITTPEQDRFAAAQSGAQAASALPTITPAQKTAVGSGTDTSASDALIKKLHESTTKPAQAAPAATATPAQAPAPAAPKLVATPAAAPAVTATPVQAPAPAAPKPIATPVAAPAVTATPVQASAPAATATGGNNALQETPRTLSHAAAQARAAEPGIGKFKGDENQTFMEALTHSTAQNLREALDKPLLQYPENIFPNMSQAEVDGLKRLTELAQSGDPQAKKIMLDLEKDNPELLKTFNDGMNILQSVNAWNSDLKEYMGKAADLTGTGASAITPKDMQNYQNPLDALKERIRERMFQDFQKNDLRRFQDMFTGKQSFFGSRRKEIQKDLMNNFQDKLADLDAKFGVENEQKAYERTLADRMRMLQAGGQFGSLNAQSANNALNANAQDIARAQAMSGTSLAKLNQDLMRQNLRRQLAQDQSTTSLRANEAAMNAGAVERANDLDQRKEKYIKFREQADHRINNATKMLDAARGFQMNYPAPPMMTPNVFNSTLFSTPQPAQVYNSSKNGMFGAAASLAGSLDKALNPQGLNRFKSGGVVERKFLASGGVAENLMRQKMAQAMTPQPQPQPAADPYQQFMGNAQGVSDKLMNRANNPGNPSGAFLRDYGANLMAADPNKTATQQVGEALKAGNAAYDKMEGQPLNDYDSALNIQQVMHNTKKAVDEYKANQAIKREELDIKRQDQNLKRATMSAMMGYGTGDPSLSEVDAKGKPTKRANVLAKLDEKILLESRAQVNASQSLLVQLDTLKKLIPKVNSGAVVGAVSKVSPYFGQVAGGGNANDIATFDALSKSIISSVEKMDPSRPLAARLKLIENSKMGVNLPAETNMKLLNELAYIKEMVMHRAMFVQNAFKNGIHASFAEDAYNKYIEAVFDGQKDVTPMDFLDVDDNKKSNLQFHKMESYKEKLENNEFFSEDELRKLASENKSKKSIQTSKTAKKQSDDNDKTFTKQDAEDYAKSQNISIDEAIKMYTDSGWKLKD